MGLRNLNHFSLRNHPVPPLSPRARLVLPVFLGSALFFFSFLILPASLAMVLGGLMIAYYIPPSGKESLIPLGIALGIPWWLMAFTLAYLDVVTSLFMILNLDRAERFPYLGPWITRSLAAGREFMVQRPWLARWRVPGVALFVMLPLQGTGGVGATIVGIMAGLSPAEILLAVGIGATIECLVFALGSEIIIRLLATNTTLGLAVVAAIVLAVLLYVFVSRYRNRKAPS
ncbi:MAG: small multi-drug export protein [Methanomicrobiales archaeon]|nr:small multi-drug export protein [Methanomicrobiales archaeon]NYT20435.1 small multi-drug export protein [Methanomicrobiales archaeon]